METWRKKAHECLPEYKDSLGKQETTIYFVFFEMLPLTIEAHKKRDTKKLKQYYAFAEWCFRQDEKELWNAAGVAFYEHLGNYPETRKGMHRFISRELYKDIRGLIAQNLDKGQLKEFDLYYKI